MAEMTEKPSQLVACVGNMLMLDEGFGPYMAKVLTDPKTAGEYFDAEHVKRLMATFRPHETELAQDDSRVPVLDAGTMGMSMIPYIRDYDRIVVVDVVDCGPDAKPGTCYTFSPEDMADNCVMHSLHDVKIPDVLTNARLAGYDSDVRCVGVQKKNIAPVELTIGLTPEVAAAVPYAVDAIIQELGLNI